MKENNFYKTKDLLQLGYTIRKINKLENEGKIKKIENGYYFTGTIGYDELAFFQFKYKYGIFSNITALSLLNFTELPMHNIDVTFPYSYDTTLSKHYNKYRVKDDIYELGKISIINKQGNKIFIYNLERSICEIIKNNIEVEHKKKIISTYLTKHKDVSLLREYAKIFKVTSELEKYIEVLYG